MPPASPRKAAPTILPIGASRGLGHAMAAEFLEAGWTVVGTVRDGPPTRLHDLAEASEGRVEIEILDICEPDQVAALRHRLSGRVFDMLFVNAGVTNEETETVAEVTTDEFVRVMVTNAPSPMRVVESLEGCVRPEPRARSPRAAGSARPARSRRSGPDRALVSALP